MRKRLRAAPEWPYTPAILRTLSLGLAASLLALLARPLLDLLR